MHRQMIWMAKLTHHRLGKTENKNKNNKKFSNSFSEYRLMNLPSFVSSFSLSTSGDSGTISDSVSGKSSPANFSDHTNENGHTQTQHDVDKQQNKTNLEKNSFENFGTAVSSAEINTNCHPLTSSMSSSVIDSAARFTKLGLYDDNNSFFSTFQPSPFFKLDNTPTATQLRNLESNNQTNSPQLPDLLSGTETDKERQEMHEKLNILKGLTDFSTNSLQNGCGTGNAFDDLTKRRSMMNGLGLHSTALIGKIEMYIYSEQKSRLEKLETSNFNAEFDLRFRRQSIRFLWLEQ